MAQYCPKMAPRCPQDNTKMPPRWLIIAHDSPWWPQVAPRGPRKLQEAPKMVPKMAPRWPKMAQDGPKMVPRWVQNRSSEAFQHRSRKRETPGQSQIRIWADFGALLGPIWGPYGASWAHVRAHLRRLKIRRAKIKKRRTPQQKIPFLDPRRTKLDQKS